LIVALLCVVCAACTGTDVGNPADEGRIQVQFSALDPAGALTLESGLVIDETWLVFQEMRLWTLDDKGKCTGTNRLDIQGIFAVELVAGQELPKVPIAEKASLDLCRLDFKLSPQAATDLPEGASASLAEASILMKGTLPDGRAFSIATPMNEIISLKTKKDSVKLGENLQDILMTFDFTAWIDAELLSEIQAIQGDKVEITPETKNQQSLLSSLQKNLKKSVKLNPDTNADGRSQSTERVEVLAEGEVTTD
jgi:hypothetical protein